MPPAGNYMPRNATTIPGSQVRVFENAGTPTNGTSGSYAGVAETGELLIDTTNSRLYQNSGTQSSPTWSIANTQAPALNVVATSGATQTLSAASVSQFNDISISASCTFTMPAQAEGSILKVLLRNTGAFTATFTSVKWPGGTPFTLTSGSGKKDYLEFMSDGTNWNNVLLAQNLS